MYNQNPKLCACMYMLVSKTGIGGGTILDTVTHTYWSSPFLLLWQVKVVNEHSWSWYSSSCAGCLTLGSSAGSLDSWLLGLSFGGRFRGRSFLN